MKLEVCEEIVLAALRDGEWCSLYAIIDRIRDFNDGRTLKRRHRVRAMHGLLNGGVIESRSTAGANGSRQMEFRCLPGWEATWTELKLRRQRQRLIMGGSPAT